MSDSGDDCDYSVAAPPPLPDGVQKDILQKGSTNCWKQPKEGDELTVHYEGTFEDGQKFDSSLDRGEPVKFTLGKGQVIKGWDLGIATMIKGEKARLTIQPEFAYGENGQPPSIPPNAVLIFEVELISWISKDDLFDDDGCVKSLMEEGRETWVNPTKGQEVCLSMKALSQKGAVIEDLPRIDYDVGSFTLGAASRVVEKALLGMSKGEKCVLACAKDYVYQGTDHGKVKIELELHEIYNTSDVSLLKDGTAMKKTTQEGSGHERPEDMYGVRLKVVSATDGSKPLPGFSGPKELEFKSGNGEVCDVLEGVAVTMTKGECALLTCTAPGKVQEPKLGLADISASKVVLSLEMIDFVKGREQWALSDSDKVDLGQMRKEVGAMLFKAKRFELALAKYIKVSETIGSHDSFKGENKLRAVELKRVVELNKAACYLQINDPTHALTCCNAVLREDRNNVKALFRRAKAHFGRGEHVEAQADLERVLELDDGNAEARALLPHVKKAQRVADKASKNTFAKMCEGFGKIGSGREVKKEEPKPEQTPEPEERPDEVQVTFKIEYKPAEGETMHIVGAPDELGAWESSRAVAMRKLPQPYIPPVGSGRAPPEFHHWEQVLFLNQEHGRFEYHYLIRGPKGEERVEGEKHKCDLTGMGGSRVKCTDSWRR